MIFKASKLDRDELEVLADIDALQKRLGYMFITPEKWYGLLSRITLSRAIRGSNTIEGYEITKDEAMAVVAYEEPLDEKTEAWRANESYRRAMTYVLQLSHDIDFKYTPELIKSLHYMMLEYDLSKNPGNWRPSYINVVDNETNKIVYEGPDVDLVRPLITELIDYLNNTSSKTEHSIITGAMAHLNLTMIHPFKDGNGRMARCLQTLVLVRNITRISKFCSIEEYLGNSKNTNIYYDVLAKVGGGKWQPEKDTKLWIQFCLNAHYTQARTALKRAKELGKIWARIEDEIRNRNLNKRMIYALGDATLGYKINNLRYRKYADINKQLASIDLKRLVNEDLLIPQGQARGRYYIASGILKLIGFESKEPKEIATPFNLDNL